MKFVPITNIICPSKYLFYSFLFLILLIAIFLWYIDYFKTCKFKDIITLYLSILAQIYSIIFSITILSYEIIFKKYSSYAGNIFLKNLKSISILFIPSILLIWTSLLVENFLKCNLFRRISFFLDSYLFGICLLQIYPLTIKILQISQTQNHILEIVDSVTANDIELLTRRDMRYTEEVLDMEDNKMYILFDIGLKNIREAEILVPRLIIK